MCKLKSALILKDRVFITDYDSHSEMLDELGIEDTRANAERLFIRAELYPKDNDVFTDISTWVFNVDQDIRPEWFVEEVDKARMIEAVKEWAKTHIFIGVNNLKISSGKNIYIKDCKDVEIGNSTVEAYDNSTVKAWGNSTVIKNSYSSFKKSNLILCDNATFKDCLTKTIYQSGGWKLVSVEGK